MDNLVNNYYFLKHWVHDLHSRLAGSELVEGFGQSKREYVLQFAHETGHDSLTFFTGHQLCFAFLDQKQKPKGGVPEIGQKAYGQTVKEVGVFENDRSFYIALTGDFSWVFKLHGVHGNMILYEGETPIQMIRKNLKKDWETSPSTFHQPIEQDYSHFSQLAQEYADSYKALKTLFPTFTKDFVKYLDDQGFCNSSVDEQWPLIQQLLSHVNEPPSFYVYQEGTKEAKDPGWRLNLFHFPDPAFESHSPNEAMQFFARHYLRDFQFSLTQESLMHYWQQEKSKAEKRINNLWKHVQKLIEGYNYQTLADILMANLHQLQKGQEKVELYDFYNDQMVTIPLKKNLTPQENAERLYRKGKNQNLELSYTEENLEKEQQRLSEIEAELANVREESSFKALRKLYHETFGKKSQKQDPRKVLANKFKHFQIQDYDVYAGKGAKTNDLLTFQFANKNDIWLHAKDQTGSHVIIRNAANKSVPETVLESVASLAAYYSKGKGESMCPVAYTRKKYVWKPKGSPPGQVNYKNEAIIMAEPASPETMTED